MNVRITIDSYPFLRTLRAQLSLSKQQQYEAITQLCELLDNDFNKFRNNINSKLKLNQLFSTDVSDDFINFVKSVLSTVAMEIFFKLRELNILNTKDETVPDSLFVEHIDDNCMVLNMQRNVI
jgi:hypothetical protein